MGINDNNVIYKVNLPKKQLTIKCNIVNNLIECCQLIKLKAIRQCFLMQFALFLTKIKNLLLVEVVKNVL